MKYCITLIAKIPIAKCPIAKVPIAKCPIPECPIAKRPIAECLIAKCPIAQLQFTQSLQCPGFEPGLLGEQRFTM